MSEQSDSTKKLISDLRVNELKAELEKRGLDKGGVKATLIERLEKALKNEGHDVTNFFFNDDAGNTTSKTNDSLDTTENANNTTANKSNDDLAILKSPRAIEQNATESTQAVNSNDAEKLENASTKPSAEKNDQQLLQPNATSAVEALTSTSMEATKSVLTTIVETVTTGNDKNEGANLTNSNEKSSLSDGFPKSTENQTANDKKEQVATISKSPQKVTEHDLAASVWIRGISNLTKAADLKMLFSNHGKVVAAKIFTTKNKLSPTCFGYITMFDAASVNLCIQKLNRTNLKGKVISVEKASRSLLPQINKAGKVAPAINPTTAKSAELPLNSTESNADKKSEISLKITAKDVSAESPDIIIEEVCPSSSTTSKNEAVKESKAVANADENNARTNKNSTRPRIVSTKPASSSRKIQPPDDSSLVKKMKPVQHSSANRNVTNAPRRIVTSSNMRGYRPNGSYKISSRIRPAAAALNNARRFTKNNSGVQPYKLSHSTTSSTARLNSNRLNYRAKPTTLASRFAARGSVRNVGSTESGGYARQRLPRRELPSSSRHHDELDNSSKVSSWERNELLLTMRRREDEYRKKEEEFKLQRERERLKFERERLEREKLEIQQLKLTAQLASAQMALIPNANNQAVESSNFTDAGIGSASGAGVNGSSYNKGSKTSKKRLSESNAGGSHRESRYGGPSHSHNSGGDRRSKSRGTGKRSHSRSRSPHRSFNNESKHTSGSTAISRHNAGSKPSTRYGNSTSHHQSSFAKHSSTNNGYGGGGFSSSHQRGTASSRKNYTGISSRFDTLSGGSNYASYSRNYEQSTRDRSRSPNRRATAGRSGDRDSYVTGGVQRFLDDNLQMSHYTNARTDPSYAARVTGANSGSSGMGISADEMFGLTGSSATSGYYSGSRLSGGTYRDSLPSTYQTTLNSGGSGGGTSSVAGSGLHWSSSSNRANYMENAISLDPTSNWVSSYGNDGMNSSSTGRGEWDGYNSSISSGAQYNSGRYGVGSGATFASRRF